VTKKEFIEKNRHFLMGYVLEAAISGRRNETLSAWMRAAFGEVDQLIGRMWDELQLEFKPAAPQGAAQPQVNNGQVKTGK
jgi:hypothetical protein